MLNGAFIERHLCRRSRLSDLLYPASLLYAQIQDRRGRASTPTSSTIPVIGVGNIVSGGSGKTPFTLALARVAASEGIKTAVSHRGYKAQLEAHPTLISNGDGPIFPPSVCGDEAWLLAKNLIGVPVVVGKDRARALSLLEQLEPIPQLVLMDDVYQNHKIKKNIEIACFDARVGIGNGRVIPAGYLRERLDALQRASLCVINRKDTSIDTQALEHRLRQFCEWVEVLDYSLTDAVDAYDVKVKLDPGVSAVLVSGIASPGGFETLASQAGIIWQKHFVFADHYHFRNREALMPVLKYVHKEGIQRIYCTTKDMAKLIIHRDLKPLLTILNIRPDQSKIESIWQELKQRLKLDGIAR